MRPVSAGENASRVVMKLFRLLAASAATLATMTAATAQQTMLSETDIFALYCFGVHKTYSEGFDFIYPQSCPTGQEGGCDGLRAANVKRQDWLNRVRRYITARGYTGAIAASIAERVRFTVDSGVSDTQKCIVETLERLNASRRAPSPVCGLVQRCEDLSRLPM
jgi:hypothetical protein